MQRWHPDKYTESSEIAEATRRAQSLNHAYEVLSSYFECNTAYVRPTRSAADEQPQRAWRPPPTKRPNRPAASGRGRRFWTDIIEHGFPDERVFEVFFFSSHLVSGGYNAVDRILYQKFHNGSGSSVVYRYYDVPQTIWDGLLAASSHGQFAINYINHAFRYAQCKEANRPYNSVWRLPKQERT